MSELKTKWPVPSDDHPMSGSHLCYERARAEAAIERLRLAVRLMRHSIDCEYERDRRLRDEWSRRQFHNTELCICGVSTALDAILPIPGEQT